MVRRLGELAALQPHAGPFTKEAAELRSALDALPSDAPAEERVQLTATLGQAEMKVGNIDAAIAYREQAIGLLGRLPPDAARRYAVTLVFLTGVAHLRAAQTAGCLEAGLQDACILPPRPGARLPAADVRQSYLPFADIARGTSQGQAINVAARWLLTIAAELVGDFPHNLADDLRLPASVFPRVEGFPRFQNVASAVGLATLNYAGGAVVEDLDGDGLLDVVTGDIDPSNDLVVFRNTGVGFERVATTGLDGISAGLNLAHGDYDNDGDPDILVLRGAWRGDGPHWNNSLLRNEGDFRFRDVTFDAGLGAAGPTQVGSWADYDNDGDLDLFVGNESLAERPFPSHLYRNEGAGAFVDVAVSAGVTNDRFTKGAAWGDFDRDGYPDLYVSNMGEPNRLYRNRRDGTFVDVAAAAGVERPLNSFTTWFWDVNNDGFLDILCNSYTERIVPGAPPAIWNVAASRLASSFAAEPPSLYLGGPDGTFVESGAAWGLAASTLPMGANFGDVDGDGWLDFYLGTGYPAYHALIPNVMYRNTGSGFEEVTFSGGFGHLAKGHGIAFADLDNNGTQDVFAQMGGMWPEDQYYDAVFRNPGFGREWVNLKLVGATTNRAGVGARVKVSIDTPQGRRSIYRTISTGGSFGSDPFRAEIGLGVGARIETVEVLWPVSGATERFVGVEVGDFWELAEGTGTAKRRAIEKALWSSREIDTGDG